MKPLTVPKRFLLGSFGLAVLYECVSAPDSVSIQLRSAIGAIAALLVWFSIAGSVLSSREPG